MGSNPFDKFDNAPVAGNAFDRFDDTEPAAPVNEEPAITVPIPSTMSKLMELLLKRGGNISADWQNTGSKYTPGEQETVAESFAKSPGRVLRTAGQIAGGINDVIGQGISAAYRGIVPESERQFIGGMARDILKPAMPALSAAQQAYGAIKESAPEATANVEAVANIVGLVPSGIAGKKVLQGRNILMDAVTPVQTLAGIDQKIDQAIALGMNKGIRPTIIGKSDAGLVKKFYDNAKTAVRDIVDNSPVPLSQSPNVLEDFSKAVATTKKSLWDQATQRSATSGGRGVTIDLSSAIDDMASIAANSNIQRGNPALAKAAADYAALWAQHPRMVSPQDAEEILTSLNNASKNFYKDPNSNIPAALPARMAQKVRESLYSSMDELGPEYADLRKRYGAQLAIEKEVTDRATQYGRKAEFGFFDLANIPAAATFATGLAKLAHGDITGMLGSGAILASKYYMKRSNDTANIIRNMFKEVESLKALQKVRP